MFIVSAILAGMQAVKISPGARPTAPQASPAKSKPRRSGSIASMQSEYEYDGSTFARTTPFAVTGETRTPGDSTCIFDDGDGYSESTSNGNPYRHPMSPDAPWYRSPVGSQTLCAMMQHMTGISQPPPVKNMARGVVSRMPRTPGENANPMAITPAKPGAPTITPCKSRAGGGEDGCSSPATHGQSPQRSAAGRRSRDNAAGIVMQSFPAGAVSATSTSTRQKKSGFAAYAASHRETAAAAKPDEAGLRDGPVTLPLSTESQLL